MSNHSIKIHKDLLISFFINSVNRQTDRRTDRQTDRGENITSVTEVIQRTTRKTQAHEAGGQLLEIRMYIAEYTAVA